MNIKQKQRPQVDITALGKMQPQAVEIEQALLGVILLNQGAFSDASELLNSDCFYREGHGVIFRAMRNLASKSQPIDILTVCAELEEMGELEKAGGRYYVTT